MSLCPAHRAPRASGTARRPRPRWLCHHPGHALAAIGRPRSVPLPRAGSGPGHHSREPGLSSPRSHLPCSPVPWVAPVQSWPEGPSRTRGTRHAAAASISAGLAWLADGPGPRLRSLTPTPHRPVPPTACPAHHSEPDAAGPRGAPAEAAAPGRAPRGAAGRV